DTFGEYAMVTRLDMSKMELKFWKVSNAFTLKRGSWKHPYVAQNVDLLQLAYRFILAFPQASTTPTF
nr:hypothetical protein [Tanacetum cinerariifolium]